MDALNLVTALRGLVLDQLLEIHTNIPARVTAVNYDAKTVTLEAIVKNTRGSDDEISYPTMYDVPFMVNGGGTGRISFPIISGDIGTLLFSERDPSNALQTDGTTASSATLTQPCGIYPIMFVPKMSTGADSTESIDQDNVVISNNKQTYASFSPDGTIILKNADGISITITTTSIILTDGSGTLTISGGNLTWTGGQWNINGLIINSAGLLTDANGISLNTHTHSVTGVSTGGSTVVSNPPSGG